jgi:pyruvate dehydrogenase E1 component alpha subunit
LVDLDKQELVLLYRKMLEIRRFEEKVAELYAVGKISGLVHPYIGQEAVAVGVCSALNRDDHVLSCHRGHGHSIAKEVPAKYLLAELFGKETGVCSGVGGSMHSTYLETGVLFSTAIVGGNIPMATGVGLAINFRKLNRVVACFFGDGATNTGAFHEGLNLASLWRLPIVFVCENNLYAISTHTSRAVAAKSIAARGQAYDVPGVVADGMNVLAVRESALEAVERARKGKGPTLLECRTYRFKGHGMYDTGYSYRTKEEVKEWVTKDPIERLKKEMLSKSLATEAELRQVDADVDKTIEEAARFAEESKFPTWQQMAEILYA